MARSAIEFHGFAELDKALGDLGKSTGRRVLRKVGKDSLKPMALHAETLAPRSRGFLARSIKIGGRLSRNAAREARRGRNKADVITYMGPAPSAAAIAQEFGTIHHPAQPYMRPAWSAGKNALLANVESNLRVEIAKAAKRAARKALK